MTPNRIVPSVLRAAAGAPGARPRGTADAAPDVARHQISFGRANLIGLGLAPFVVLFAYGPFLLLWGVEDTLRGLVAATDPTWRFLAWVVAGVVAHEALHLAGFLLAGAQRRSLRYGVHRWTLTPYAGCSDPMTMGGYRLAILLPGLLLGVLPAAAAWALGAAWLMPFAFVMLLGACGDATILWLSRGVPGGAIVRDLSDRAGFEFVASPGAGPEAMTSAATEVVV